MKLNKLGKFAALCMAGCMLLGGCGAENPADEKTVTGNAADVSAEKSETRMDSEKMIWQQKIQQRRQKVQKQKRRIVVWRYRKL